MKRGRLLIIVITMGLMFKTTTAFMDTPQDGYLQKFDLIVNTVKKYYYKDLSSETLFKQACNGMLAGLDPHSAYLHGEELENLYLDTSGQFGGIGVEIFLDGQNGVRVLTPLDDTPASAAGIKNNDLILQVNGILVNNLAINEVAKMLRGKPGTRVQLNILRKVNHKIVNLKLTLRRRLISIKTIKAQLLEPGYGYLRITIFQELTEADMIAALRKMTAQAGKTGLKGLILDLRNNPGGLLESAIQIADDFLDSKVLKLNKLIVYTKGRAEDTHIVAKASPGDVFANRPMVVLINNGSASAAEIVAGALQDHKRAIVVGERSFGKGSVQTMIPIDSNSAIKLTTALFYTPKNQLIQARGIQPDIAIENLQVSRESSEVLPKLYESSLESHIATEGDSTTSKAPIDRNHEALKDRVNKRAKHKLPVPMYDLAQEDYQLYEALQILKSQTVINHNR